MSEDIVHTSDESIHIRHLAAISCCFLQRRSSAIAEKSILSFLAFLGSVQVFQREVKVVGHLLLERKICLKQSALRN